MPSDRPTLVHRFFPVTEWLPQYQRSYISGDLIAGLTVWALLIPEALAYAGVAGVPIQYGLYTAPLALLAYAIFGGGKRLIVGPSSTVAIVSASVVAPLAVTGGQDRYIALTIALALLTGLVLVVAGLSKLGFVAKFLAKPVLDGFIIGMAFTIAVGQAGKVVGVSTSGDTALQKTVSIFNQIGDWYWLPIVIGLGCFALLLVMDKTVPWLPGAIVVLIVTTLLAYLLNLGAHGLSLVGSSPAGMPSWMLTGLSMEDLYHLLPGALAVALVAFSESIAVAKDDAIRNDYEIDANQEMIANGMANIGSGLLQGFAVNGSLSKSAACETAGGKTEMTSLITAVLAFLTMLFLTGLFKYLPEATLGAIVIHALMKYFRWDGLVRLYRVRKSDFVLATTALVGVILFGILPGLIIGVVLSLALLIQRQGSPNSAVLGREPGGNLYADITNHPTYATIPGIIVYRFDGPLVFPNAERFTNEITKVLKHSEPKAREILLDAETISDMDTTASDTFKDMLDSFDRQGVKFAIARLHAPVREFMRKDGVLDRVGEENIYPRVADAVAAFENPEASSAT
jgi:sulfate permease, SulP family